jgi:hypothetical protein
MADAFEQRQPGLTYMTRAVLLGWSLAIEAT